MQRVCLAFLRYCLSAWGGIAAFFVMVVIDLRQSALFEDTTKFNHPKVLFPLYYSFEFSLLAMALLCAFAGLYNKNIGKRTRYTLFALLVLALALAIWDYGIIYQDLIQMMAHPPLPPNFNALHHRSRWINGGIMALTMLAAWLALLSGNSVTDELTGRRREQTESNRP